MRLWPLMAILPLFGCTPAQTATAPTREVFVPDHSLDAFGGRLLGSDRGEWGGKLVFQDADGDLSIVLSQNVHGIVKNRDGIFVLTGLAHGSLNEGYIYSVRRTDEEHVVATLLGRLPGAPSSVRQLRPEGITFNAPTASCLLRLAKNWKNERSQVAVAPRRV